MDTVPLQTSVLRKLAGLMGEESALVLVQEVVSECGLTVIATAADLQRFANSLMRRRGVLAAVGRSLKIQAILLGASDEA